MFLKLRNKIDAKVRSTLRQLHFQETFLGTYQKGGGVNHSALAAQSGNSVVQAVAAYRLSHRTRQFVVVWLCLCGGSMAAGPSSLSDTSPVH